MTLLIWTVILPEGMGQVAQRNSSAQNKATQNSIISATIQKNPIYYLASDKSKNIVVKNLQRSQTPLLIPLTQAHVRGI
jgi:hypothetical protein